MWKNILASSLLGGVIFFVWGMFSWMVLPWHESTIQQIPDNDAFINVIKPYFSRSGIYNYPGEGEFDDAMSADEREAVQKKAWKKMQQGPIVFVSYNTKGMSSMGQTMLVSFLIQVAAALIISLLLMQTQLTGFMDRVGFVALFTLGAGVLTHVPYWNWFGFDTMFTLIQVSDLIIGGTLAGLVIARFIQPPRNLFSHG